MSMVDIVADMILSYHMTQQRLPNKLVLTIDDAAAFCREVSNTTLFGRIDPIGQTVCGCLIVEAPKAKFSFVTFDSTLSPQV